MDVDTWEGIAADILGETGCDDGLAVDAFELAACCGLDVRTWRRPLAMLDRVDRTIWVSDRVRRERQHMSVAHELGHWALTRAGEPDSEDGARWIGGALMLPRRVLDRDLRSGWSITRLRSRHVNASAEAIATRVTQLRSAVVTVVDQGRARKRFASRGFEHVARTLTRRERRMIDAATEQGVEICEGLACATPIVDGPHRRVVLVCHADAL